MQETGRIDKNDTDLISAPRQPRKLPYVVSEIEIERLLATPDTTTTLGIRDRTLLELIYASGIRVSEANSIDTTDVDLKSREIRVFGKGSKQRIVLLGTSAANWLSQYLSQSRAKLATRQSAEALFLNNLGGRLSTRSIQNIVKKHALAAGLDAEFHTHNLPTYLRHPPAERRSRPPSGSRSAWTRIPVNHPDLHPRLRRTGPKGIPQRTPWHKPQTPQQNSGSTRRVIALKVAR